MIESLIRRTVFEIVEITIFSFFRDTRQYIHVSQALRYVLYMTCPIAPLPHVTLPHTIITVKITIESGASRAAVQCNLFVFK